jgi:uncharacterized FlgJ-related protein
MNAILVLDFDSWQFIDERNHKTGMRRLGKWKIFFQKDNLFLENYKLMKKDNKHNSLLEGYLKEDFFEHLGTISYTATMAVNAKMTIGTQGMIENNRYDELWSSSYIESMNELVRRLRVSWEVNKALLYSNGEMKHAVSI